MRTPRSSHYHRKRSQKIFDRPSEPGTLRGTPHVSCRQDRGHPPIEYASTDHGTLSTISIGMWHQSPADEICGVVLKVLGSDGRLKLRECALIACNGIRLISECS